MVDGWISDWGYETTYSRRKKKHKKFIQVFAPQVDDCVWVQWNGNENDPRIYRWDEDKGTMWWMEWDIEVSGSRQADEIPSVKGKNFSHTENYRPPKLEEESQKKRKK